MESSMQRLINNLKKVSESEEAFALLEPDFENEGIFWLNETSDDFKANASKEITELLEEISSDLNEWLISDSGHHHFPNRETLSRFGYSFEKGEEDSFGVLTAVIVIPCKNNDNKQIRILYG